MKIICYLALSLGTLSSANADVKTNRRVSAAAPSQVVSQKKKRVLPAGQATPPTMKYATYKRRVAAFCIGRLLPTVIFYSFSLLFREKTGKSNFGIPVLKHTVASRLIMILSNVVRLILQVYPKNGGFSKYLLGMKVVDEKGGDLDYGRLVLRSVIKYLAPIIESIISLLYLAGGISEELEKSLLSWVYKIWWAIYLFFIIVTYRLAHNYLAGTDVVMINNE